MKDNTIGISKREFESDLRYMYKLLRHKSSKTTEIYTHESMCSHGKIISPLGRLAEKGSDK